MATYDELRGRFEHDQLHNRIEVAVIVKAHAILNEGSPTADRLDWAATAFNNTETEGKRMLKYLLAEFKDLDIAVIDAADGAEIQPKVNDAIDQLYPVP